MLEINRRKLLGAGMAGATLAVAAPSLSQGQKETTLSPRKRLLLDTDWRFHLGHAADIAKDFNFGLNQRTYAKAGAQTADAAMPGFDARGWAEVQIPHDWAIALPDTPPRLTPSKEMEDAVAAHGFKPIGRDYPENSVGWYRRALDISLADQGRCLSLEFDGVFRDCLVFINGYIVHRNDSGYAPFSVEISDFLNYDGSPNVLALRVDASLGEGWFYEGAGIYRHVWLVRTGPVHIPQWGTFVRAEVGADGARLTISTEVANGTDVQAHVTLRQSLRTPNGAIITHLPDVSLSIASGETVNHDDSALLRAPQLWSIETPQLYTLITEAFADDKLIDHYETPFGIRAVRFDAAHGFFLNGQPTKLLGTCNHQDHAGVGTAIPDRLHEWRVEQLKSMGSNAWRSAHNPPSQALLDICDAKGMMMIVEARLNSSSDEAMNELERMVRRDRNHPCVILWSVGNEEPHQGTPRGARISAAMVRKVKALDPTRLTTQAFDNGFDAGATRVVDVIGFNYRTEQIEAFHQRHPDQPIIGTETGSTVATRGEYVNDPAQHILRAYDTEHPWWASTAEEWWTIAAAHPYIAGGFIWTGFDYRGEPTPFSQWPSVSSSFGVLDNCGFPKDNYWYYRAWWKPNAPMVHLLPHWNWAGQEGQPIEIWAHSNCDAVELFVNGQSAGRKVVARNRHVAWTVPYAPGVIEARGYRAGAQTIVVRRETTGPATGVRLIADRRRIAADGRDLVVVRVEIIDRAGRLVPNAKLPLQFEVSGTGRMIGAGNGDPTCHDAARALKQHSFNGLCQLLVQSLPQSGLIKVRAAAPNITPTELTVIVT